MRTILHVAMLGLALASAGCLRKTEFQCTDNTQCGGTGQCEITGYCSFTDGECESGRRYDNSAGPLAGQCTGGGTVTDGRLIDTPMGSGDAPMGDAPPAGCPGGYAALTGGEGNHLYKLLAVAENWTVQESQCQLTSASSHLAVPGEIMELTAIDTLVGGGSWVGITDSAQEMTWRNVLGQIQTYLPWEPPAPDNNAGGQGEDCVESLNTAAHTINDRRCNDKLPAVCECAPP